MIRHDILIKLLQFGIFLLLFLYGYSNVNRPLSSWKDEKLIIAISQNTTLADEEFAKQLVKKFATYLDTPLKIVLMPADKIESAFQKHEVHFAASGFRTDEKAKSLLFGPGYLTVREQVAYNLNRSSPRKIADLCNKRIAVIAGSNHEKVLLALQKDYPNLIWESRTKQTVEDLLTEVAKGELDYTLANHEQIEHMHNFHINLSAAFDIGKPTKLAWAFPADTDNELITAAEQFFSEMNSSGELNMMLDRYYGHNDRLIPLDAATFIEQSKKTLPKYRAFFEEAGKIINEDWRLIAAIAYQESHWDPLATSFTNVRGMMMLTEATADRMRVSNRLDARESTIAGAKYLDLIKKQLPIRIKEPERTWLALSAYNQGQGHLEDARVLTQRNGDNPDIWIDVKKWLPLLSNPSYFQNLKYGYARGGEAAAFVENIRAYYDILARVADDNETDTAKKSKYQLASTRSFPAFSLRAPNNIKPPLVNPWPGSAYSLSQ